MANMIPISTITVGSGGSAAIEFTGIPQTYTDLKILGSARTVRSGASSDYLEIRFNGSSASGYEYITVQGNGSAASSSGGGSPLAGTAIGFDRFPSSTATANTFGNFEIYIPNYTASRYKFMSSDQVAENNSSETTLLLQASVWANTAPINSIRFSIGGGTLIDVYSTFTLYGIRKY
jgi:hypothetical protein